jgi:hypothetical protein
MAPAYIQRASQVQPAAARQEDEILTVEDEAMLDSIEADLDKVSPAATKAAYGPPQKEFREWCLRRAEKEGKTPLEGIADPVQRAMEDVKRSVENA